MGRRSDIVAAVIARIGEILNPEGTVNPVLVTAFEGDEREFNREERFPSIWVEYSGRTTQPNQVVGGVFQPKTYHVTVYFCYADHSAALAALEAVDENLPGELGSLDRLIESAELEELVATDEGRLIFVQLYTVNWDA